MQKPDNVAHLATLLAGTKFKRIESLTDLIGEDAVDFFVNLEKERILVMPDFPRYIPIINERISVKKYDYNLTTHIIFWLADGQPYIYTPDATIEHIRLGMCNQKLTRGGHLMIPHNCNAFDVLALSERRCNLTNSEILDLVITRYGK